MAQTYSSAIRVSSAHARATAKKAAKLPWPIWVFIGVMLLPGTVAFYAGPVLVTSYRFFMILLFIPIMLRLFSGRVKLGLPDALIAGFSLWAVMCILMNFGMSAGSERAGQLILEATLAYFLSRLFIERLDQLYGIIRPFFIITAISLVLAIPEAISHQKPIIELTSRITGISTGFYVAGTDVRMGLRRAQVFFENPILYGLFCASCLSLVWYTERRTMIRLIKVLVIIAATFFSISSAPLLAITMQLLMIVVEVATRTLPNRATIIVGGSFLLVSLLQIFSQGGPVGIIINYLTFNQDSSYNRVHIWNFGLENIMRHPIFGMIPENWQRGAWMKVSIDNFWIYNGLMSGFVGWGLLTAAVILIIRRLGTVPLRNLTPMHINFRRGWTLMIVAVIFTGFSVHFFGKLQPYFYFMLGVGGAAGSIFATDAKRIARERSAFAREKSRRTAEGQTEVQTDGATT